MSSRDLVRDAQYTYMSDVSRVTFGGIPGFSIGMPRVTFQLACQRGQSEREFCRELVW